MEARILITLEFEIVLQTSFVFLEHYFFMNEFPKEGKFYELCLYGLHLALLEYNITIEVIRPS